MVLKNVVSCVSFLIAEAIAAQLEASDTLYASNTIVKVKISLDGLLSMRRHESFPASTSVGLYVIATARRPEVLTNLADKDISTLALDVTDADSIK
jgi:hypothetical protein